jgi:pimeloyl-ACP methyl ester carboxylesterase
VIRLRCSVKSGCDRRTTSTSELPGRVVGVGVLNGVTGMGWASAWDGYSSDGSRCLSLHGEQDPYVPVAHGRHAAEVIPGARFVLLPRQGHVSLLREIPQLCADLLAASKGLAR